MNIPVLIDGFDMLVDGDLRSAERAPNAGPSLTILIRGPAGVGKTILAAKLAVSAARAIDPARGADVAYGCIELLPAELRAQLDGIDLDPKLPHLVTAPFAVGSVPRTFAAVLDLDEPPRPGVLPAAIDALLGAAASADGTPRVVVVDSLSAGYGLGGDAPRVLADAVAKLAIAKGLVLILVEEAYPEDRSVWPFAVDVVIELRPGERDREMRVTKNRLGFAMPGWHAYSLTRQAGLRVYPEPSTYLRSRAAVERFARFHPWDQGAQAWGLPSGIEPGVPFRDSITAVIGLDDADIRRIVDGLGGAEESGVDLVVPLDMKSSELLSTKRSAVFANGVTSFTGARLLAMVRQMAAERREPIRRVLVGDLGVLVNSQHERAIRQGVEVLADIFRAHGVPVVLFESGTSAWTRAATGDGRALVPSGSRRPTIALVADVVVETLRVSPGVAHLSGVVTVARDGVRRPFVIET